ncbi:Hypothetical protein SRAE_2000521300 [Strongyloides ratti]|uniref:Uncharacterized protein n=1 Tax=Strongyloides ratti TaxID=34506 RepID=A0A090LQX8_STRRB|nr:Hypothetical protein SRAE_2000521300 [Strongyloides ratti]CEF70586.1 Hypothetical protein SRAE_2000521300 [Strongyloides ratti]
MTGSVNFTIILLLYTIVYVVSSLHCMTCNIEEGSNDMDPCIDISQECPEGTNSCSMLVYTSTKSKTTHTRKFCTPIGSDLSNHLSQFPQTGLCQKLNYDSPGISMDINDMIDDSNDNNINFPKPPPLRARRNVNIDNHPSPPSPPSNFNTNILCVCMNALCNSGTLEDVIKQKNEISKIEAEAMAVGIDDDLMIEIMNENKFNSNQNVGKIVKKTPEEMVIGKKSQWNFKSFKHLD